MKKRGKPIIQVRELWKIYRMGEEEAAALKGVSLDILQGDMLYFRDIRFRKKYAAEPSCGDGEAHGGRGADPGSTGKPHE